MGGLVFFTLKTINWFIMEADFNKLEINEIAEEKWGKDIYRAPAVNPARY